MDKKNYINYSDKTFLKIDTPKKLGQYIDFKTVENNNEVLKYKELHQTERYKLELETNSKNLSNRLLFKIGYVGRLFGAEEAAKMNILAVAIFILLGCIIACVYKDEITVLDKLLPVFTLLVGYIFGKGK